MDSKSALTLKILNPITPVILSGGAGVRLWPLSRQLRPKQFLDLIDGGLSLFRSTLNRVAGEPFGAPIVMCSQNHRFIVAEELAQAGLSARNIILEPVPRNTAPAIAVAALLVDAEDTKGMLLVLPSDHAISDVDSFKNSVMAAVELADAGMLVTFGIEPVRPETGYGYIRRGAPHGDGFRVDLFVEKPDIDTAEQYCERPEYYWNTGIFVFRATAYLDEISRHSPDVLAAAKEALKGAKADLDFLRLDPPAFATAPSISIDYAVMEKTDRAAVVPLSSDWSDVGSWASLAELSEPDDAGNVRVGDSVVIDSRNNYLHSEKPLLAVLGLDDIALIATDDTVLVLPKSRTQEVKALVAELAERGRDEIVAHTRVYRPWGHYQSVDSGAGFLVKQIVVKAGAKLSLQYHNHRAEHWVVVEGKARVTNGDDIFDLDANQSTYIPVGVRHRLENLGATPLRLIEVQTGEVISEDDIVRLDDTYGRA